MPFLFPASSSEKIRHALCCYLPFFMPVFNEPSFSFSSPSFSLFIAYFIILLLSFLRIEMPIIIAATEKRNQNHIHTPMKYEEYTRYFSLLFHFLFLFLLSFSCFAARLPCCQSFRRRHAFSFQPSRRFRLFREENTTTLRFSLRMIFV